MFDHLLKIFHIVLYFLILYNTFTTLLSKLVINLTIYLIATQYAKTVSQFQQSFIKVDSGTKTRSANAGMKNIFANFMITMRLKK